LISHVHGCAFVHVPKTGGTSIELALTGHDWITRSPEEYAVYLEERSRYNDRFGGTLCEDDPDYFRKRLEEKHASQAALRTLLGEDRWRAYFKFVFVRNPWRRLLSIHAHGRRDAPQRMPERFRVWLAEPEPVDHMGQPVFHQPVDRWEEFDFVGRFERIESDFRLVAARLGISAEAAGLPHERHGSDGRHCLDRYDRPARRRVAEFFAEEIERFGYRFDDDTERAEDPGSSEAA